VCACVCVINVKKVAFVKRKITYVYPLSICTLQRTRKTGKTKHGRQQREGRETVRKVLLFVHFYYTLTQQTAATATIIIMIIQHRTNPSESLSFLPFLFFNPLAIRKNSCRFSSSSNISSFTPLKTRCASRREGEGIRDYIDEAVGQQQFLFKIKWERKKDVN
jgi:hypothetical protein